jgi:hypothetical protein
LKQGKVPGPTAGRFFCVLTQPGTHPQFIEINSLAIKPAAKVVVHAKRLAYRRKNQRVLTIFKEAFGSF